MLPFDESAARNIAAGTAASRDAGLREVIAWFREHKDFEKRMGDALRQSVDEVLDGQRTGRFDIASLEKTEKTYLGTKVEIIVRTAFGLPHGTAMDYAVAGHEVDSKFTSGSNWTIPGEALGHICLLTSVNDDRSLFKAGLVRIEASLLNGGANRDGKRGLSAAGRASVVWLAEQGQLPVNLLLGLRKDVRGLIMSHRGGQQRINELFRQVQGELIHRNTLLTVAKQNDGPKRARDARIDLRPEGIVVLGHMNQQPRIARELGLPVPSRGSWISARVVPVPPSTERESTEVGGERYALAQSGEPHQPGPAAY